MKKVIIFDFDNTLVWSLKDWKQMIDHDTATHFGVEENLDFEKTRHGLSNRDTAALFIQMHPVNTTVNYIIDFWYKYMEDKYKTSVKMVDGVLDFLQSLREKGYTLVLASATGKSLLYKAIDIFDLRKYFDHIVCEDDVGKSKKDPDIFLKILEMTSARVEECLYIEDSHIAINTAKGLGFDCVGIISELNEKHLESISKNCILTANNFSSDLVKKLGL